MRVQPSQHLPDDGPLAALDSVLGSIESVRNVPALQLTLFTFALSGLCASWAQKAMGGGSGVTASLWLGAAALVVYFGTFASGLVLMDEARGRPGRRPLDALGLALRRGHRLLLVVLTALLVAAGAVALVTGLLMAARWRWPGSAVMGLTVALGVPLLGLATVLLVAVVGPLAAPAVWFGLSARETLALIVRHARRRLAHAVLLWAAVSLLGGAVAALVSFAVLAGGRLLALLAVAVVGLDLAPEPFLGTLFGVPIRVPLEGPPPSPVTVAAGSGAVLVFALGLVLPGVVYLRGLCEVFLALQRQDAARQPPEDDPKDTDAPNHQPVV